MEFTKKDLYYKDYSDTATSGDDPDKKKEDSVFINRSEVYEVVDFLNGFLKRYDRPETLDNFQKAEKILRNDFKNRRIRTMLWRAIHENWDDDKYKNY